MQAQATYMVCLSQAADLPTIDTPGVTGTRYTSDPLSNLPCPYCTGPLYFVLPMYSICDYVMRTDAGQARLAPGSNCTG